MAGSSEGGGEREPLGISYEEHDGTTMPKLGDFDLVAAIWPLSHVGDRKSYDRMVANLAANLIPGGHLVAVVPNPETDWVRMATNPATGCPSPRPSTPANARSARCASTAVSHSSSSG